MMSFVRTHLRTIVVGGVVAVAGAGTGVGIAAATGGSSTSSAAATTTTTVPAASASGAGAGTGTGKAKTPHLKGTITSMSPTSWVVTSKSGKAFTVDISSSTKFGSHKSQETASSFSDGETVVVDGSRQGTTITATRIEEPKSASTGSATSATS